MLLLQMDAYTSPTVNSASTLSGAERPERMTVVTADRELAWEVNRPVCVCHCLPPLVQRIGARSVTAAVRARSASTVDLPPNPREVFQIATRAWAK